MNLHKLTRGMVGSVNPNVTASIQKSIGYTTAADGTRTPAYAPAVFVRVQIQALQYNDIAQLDGLNIQGERRAMYISGNWEGIVRADGSGGDLITLPDGSLWLVAQVLEDWGGRRGWVKVAVTRQNQ
jgi:hypothetical protein